MIEKESGLVPVAVVKDLGRMIRRRRLAQGLSFADAAALCDVGTRFLFEIENGKASVEFDRVMRVAARMGISLYAQERAPVPDAR